MEFKFCFGEELCKEEFITRVIYKEDNPWWVAKDVCNVLGLNVRDSVRYLDDDDEKTYVSRKHLGLTPGKPMVLINEPGLYSLILRSKKPRAKAFKRWVTHEVLPTIRKTGEYRTKSVEDYIRENPLDYMIGLLTSLKEKEEDLKIEKAKTLQLEESIEQNAHKVKFADRVANSKDVISMNEFSKFLFGEGIDIGRGRLFRFLREQKILMKDNTPYQYYMNLGIFKVKETLFRGPTQDHINSVTYVTGKGQEYLYKKISSLY